MAAIGPSAPISRQGRSFPHRHARASVSDQATNFVGAPAAAIASDDRRDAGMAVIHCGNEVARPTALVVAGAVRLISRLHARPRGTLETGGTRLESHASG
jgi:hypothetical protein